jgi:4-carboxymuconolactone decarboxylase
MTTAQDSTPNKEPSGAQKRAHLGIAKTNGVTETELKEVIIHLAFYAGWPRAMSAIMVAKEVFAF